MSASLLKLWAYFDRQDVWFELLRHANFPDNRWIQEPTKDELNFNEAVALLCSFGLVDLDGALQQQITEFLTAGGINYCQVMSLIGSGIIV